MAWTDARDSELKRLWCDECLSASQVANELGNVTRNAVIGRVNRLGLGKRANETRPRSRKRRKPRANGNAPNRTVKAKPWNPNADQAPPPPPIFRGPPAPEPDGTVTILTIRNGLCRFPIGDPGEPDFCFCGAPCDVTESYCTAHQQIAYVPAPSRRKREARHG